ncbi:hypothetical protein GCM10011571_11470 [Marinithermofilum abyssi]|uniref:LysM domain-containing protein n=1 Tax=Marinithermofilum abyssi TaxID=1571185 RepID=A0A8J2VEL9_9BACL|nr:LysM peptidoglycan-binding domain-containing protein [Marinithermofilum abyssi]GGE11783.1 hypothetical protein GCM10011571_11470 [Marinithermofilum abyssi]
MDWKMWCSGLIVFLSLTGFLFDGSGEADFGSLKVIKVHPGDTLWEIAQAETDSSQDVREVMTMIREINQLENTELHPGQTLKIPVNPE